MLKVGLSWSKSGKFMIFAFFAIFNKLYNFLLRATFFILYETYPNLQGVIINTMELYLLIYIEKISFFPRI